MAHRPASRKARQKRGRKPKNGPRTPSGRLSRSYTTVARDFGTLEIQARRKAAVGENGDPNQSTTAIGILCERGALAVDDPELSIERREAGLRYRRLRSAIYGPPWPSNVIGHDASDERLLRAQRQFTALVGFWVPVGEWCPAQEPEERFLQGRLTREQIVVVERVCVFDEAITDRELLIFLIAGLDAIRGEKTTAIPNAA